MKDKNLPEEEVKVKVSSCKKCTGWVRAAVEHMMDGHAKRDFGKEVVEYDLNIETVPLLEWREDKRDMCNCE